MFFGSSGSLLRRAGAPAPLPLINPSPVFVLLRQRFSRRRVVSCTSLNFVALFGPDLQLAVAAVKFCVRGSKAQVVLAAELGGNLVKGLAQLVELVPHVNDAASGLFGELA